MFSQSFPEVYGATHNERAYTIDGMDITWAGGEGFVISYLDAHMFEEVNLQTASASAESAKGGLITNMVTKTGSNRLMGTYNFSGGGSGTSFNNLSGRLLTDLLAAVSLRPRHRHSARAAHQGGTQSEILKGRNEDKKSRVEPLHFLTCS